MDLKDPTTLMWIVILAVALVFLVIGALLLWLGHFRYCQKCNHAHDRLGHRTPLDESYTRGLFPYAICNLCEEKQSEAYYNHD